MPAGNEQGKTDVLEYIASMLRELRQLAQSRNFDMLAYLIDMAQLEASDLMCSEKGSDIRRNQRDSAA